MPEPGGAAYLLKPIRQSELREAIAQALGTKPAEVPLDWLSRLFAGYSRILNSPECARAEDNPVNQRLINSAARKEGTSCGVDRQWREALDALDKDSFDLVFMDVQMPELPSQAGSTEGTRCTPGQLRGSTHGSGKHA